MIVTLKKLTVLLHHAEKEPFIEALRELGVVHVEERPDAESAPLAACRDKMEAAQRVLAALRKVKRADRNSTAADPLEAEELIELFSDLEQQREALSQEMVALQRERGALEPWGDFSPHIIERLAAAGVHIRLLIMKDRVFREQAFGDAIVEVIHRVGGRVFLCLVESGEPLSVDAEEMPLPSRSLADLCREIEALTERLSSCRRRLDDLATMLPVLEGYVAQWSSQARFEAVRVSLEEAVGGAVLCLTGWIPCEQVDHVTTFLDGFSAWYETKDPLPGDAPPVLLRNNAYARLFEPITRIFSLPSYFEPDPTPYLAPFFTLFVGLCIGDLGYGIILIVLSAIAYWKVRATYRPIAVLMMIIGVSVAVCGLLLNSFFGATLLGGPGVPAGTSLLASGADHFALLGPVKSVDGTHYPAMTFAVVVGFVQILLGMVLRATNRIRTRGLVHGLLPISHILMVVGGLIWGAHVDIAALGLGTLAIGPLAIGAVLTAPPLVIGKILTGLGLFVLIFFNNPDKKLHVRAPLGLWELYGFVSGIFGDAMSYLRLFALGLAGGLLGSAYIHIAFMFVRGEDGVINYSSPMMAVTLLVLILGHTFNLIVSLIGSFVHPLRLTFVEFYRNLDFQGGGRAYTPFAALRQSTREST